MSNKRQATTDLNHDNWDQDDPAEHEEMGSYKVADQEVLAKRVIRTAKRRSHLSSPSAPLSSDETKKSVFSGFGGFNKTQPSSFDFLSNLTNGNKTNGSTEKKTESPVTSNLFNNNKSSGNTSSIGFFSAPVTTAVATKPTFGSPSSQANPMFSTSTVKTSPSPFFAMKTDSKVDSPFKPAVTAKTDATAGFTFKMNSPSSDPTSSPFQKLGSTVSSPDPTSTKSSPSKIQPFSSNTITESNNSNIENKTEKKNDNDSKKLSYYGKLKGLNESVSSWIKKHVEETPLCILTPIFEDYKKHLSVIQEEYLGDDNVKKDTSTNEVTLISKNSGSTVESSSPEKSSASSLLSAFTSNTNAASTSSVKSNHATSVEEKLPTPFSFGIKTTPNTNTTAATTTTGFSFGITKTASPAENKAEPASLSFGGSTPAPFSFGIGQKFSFSPNTIKAGSTGEEKTDVEDDDQPPKVEYTPVVEDNSVFDKRCKIFVKKDGNFVDKGVGTLYIKKIEETGKHQLIVRANTNLGTVLINTILASAIPTQRMGKNNVMMVCIPTPDAKPPPTPILIRVKTAEEADELLETLNNYKA